MTYAEALAYISKQGRFGMKLGTERTRAILDGMGAPDRHLRGALIAGTNGKGSTGACLAAILRAAGRNVGFMPKPHLISYTERIELNGTGDAATVADVVFVGAFTRILVDTDRGERLTVVRQNDGSRVEPGARVHIAWRDADAYEIKPPEQPLEQEVR